MLKDETRNVEIGAVDAAEMGEAVGVIVRGMRDNPNIVAAFGQDPGVRHKRLLRLFGATAAAEVPGRDRDMLAARGPDGEILGVCGMMPPGRCQPGFGRQLRIAPALLALGLGGAGRTMTPSASPISAASSVPIFNPSRLPASSLSMSLSFPWLPVWSQSAS